MEKRPVVLGIFKKKKKVPINKIDNKKTIFFKNVLEYLRSDSYLFALLTSPASLLASKLDHSYSLTTREVADVKGKCKNLTEKIREYLKSDNYLYAPLCDPQHVTYHKGYASFVKRLTMEISTKKLIAKNNQLTMGSSNVTVEDRISEGHLSQGSIGGRKRLPRKCVKHKIYHNSRSLASVRGAMQWR